MDRQAAHDEQQLKRRDQALVAARKQRELQRKAVFDRLKAAEDREDKKELELDAAIQSLSDSRFQLAKANSDLEKTMNELALLSDKEVELVSVEISL